MTSDEDIYKQAYEEIMSGCADPTEQLMAVHMWERWQGMSNKPDTAGMEARKEEIGSVLAVMANEENAVYTDRGYLHFTPGDLSPKGEDHFATRYQRGNDEGIIAIATTPFYKDIEIPLFSRNSKTGVLLKDPAPVFVAPHDIWSSYYEGSGDIPNQNAWQEVCEFINKHTASHHQHLFSHYYFRENPEELPKLSGKLALMRRIPTHPLDDITTSQVEFNEQGYALVDPLSPQQQVKAKEAYIKLTEELRKDSGFLEALRHPEINVNATLDKAVAIIASNAPEKNMPVPAVVDPSQSWMENLQDNVELTKTLYRAFKEHEQLAAAQKKHGIERKPTIVIYQPQSKEHPIIHAAPTPKLKRAVDSLMKQHGLLASEEIKMG